MIRPAALALALLVALPVLLHWLTRSRPRQRLWAAWRFLPQPDPADTRRRRLDEPGLLALRSATVFALALAAALPTCERSEATDPAAIDVIAPRIVVDLSASMGVGAAGKRPLDRVAARLDAWWRGGGWSEGEVWGCRGSERVLLHAAPAPPPQRFLAAIEAAWHWGGADLIACIGAATTARDLIVLSDQPPPRDTAWSGWRSARWLALGDPGVDNAALGEVRVTTDRTHVRIVGRVHGAPSGARVRLSWEVPQRPAVDIAVTDSTFAVELLKPRSLGRLVLRLVGQDAAAWDDVVPLWLPAGDRPEVHLEGAWPPYAEHRLLDLLYAASDRIHGVAGEQTPTPGMRHVWLLYRPESIETERTRRILADIEAGGTAVVFAAASAGASPWVPGWLHPEQDTPQPDVRVGEALRRRWPDLAEADWSTVVVRRVLPLAEPQPATEIWLETSGGLPLLTRMPLGAGAVFTFTVPLEASATNLPYTAVWVPLWLAMLDVLATDAGSAEVVDAGMTAEAGARSLVRHGTVLSGGAPGRWLGWAELRDTAGVRRLRSTRVPAGEAVAGAEGLTILTGAAGGGVTMTTVARPMSAWWLTVALLLWLAQGVWSERRRGLVLLLAGIQLALPAVASAQGGVALTAWVPSESAPTPGAVEGIRWLSGTWRGRASPEVAPAVREFSWRATDPGEPWVWWLGCKTFDPVADPVLARRTADLVRRHGTLWLDVCGGPLELERAAERVADWAAAQGWGERWRRLGSDHVLWRTFYLLDGWQDPDGATAVYGLEFDGAERILLFANLGMNVARDAVGGWVRPLSQPEREALVRQSTNLLLYLTTYDYKTDSIHLPFILERRRRHR